MHVICGLLQFSLVFAKIDIGFVQCGCFSSYSFSGSCRDKTHSAKYIRPEIFAVLFQTLLSNMTNLESAVLASGDSITAA